MLPKLSMLVVNLYAGPCVGKSLMSADIFARLKRAGVMAENPPEVAKIRAQRGDHAFLEDQLAVFAENQHQLSMAARSGAEVAVSDSPLMLSLVYAPRPYLDCFPVLVQEVDARYESLNYVIRRDHRHGYSMVGRVHTEAEAKSVDTDICRMLDAYGREYRFIDSSEASADAVVRDVIAKLGRQHRQADTLERSATNVASLAARRPRP